MKTDVIDKEVWEGLREFEKSEGMPGFFMNLLGTALVAAKTQMEGLVKAADEGEAKRVHYYAHTLKSSCASLGAMGLAQILGEIESGALNKPPVIRKDLLNSMVSSFDDFIQEVQTEHSRLQKDI